MAKPADFLTTAQVAEMVGRSRDTVERAVRLGRLTPAHRGAGVRGQMLFSRADVESFAKAKA